MTIRHFLVRTQHAQAGRRAEAAAALARAYLYGALSPEGRWEARQAMLALLDDASPLVRRALAEACAHAVEAPRALVVALAHDQAAVAELVLAYSPVLVDADLVDCAAIGDEPVRAAIARRPYLSGAVAATLAEIGGAPSLRALAANPGAELDEAVLLRLVARHGEDGALREAILARADTGAQVRQAVAARLADTLSAFVVGCGWLSPERGARAAREAREAATLGLCADAERADLARFALSVRAAGHLTPGLILRAVLCGRMAFVEAALADLADLPPARVAGLLHGDRRAFAALYRRAGLPAPLEPAFAAALSAWREEADGFAERGGARLSRRMIERALTACEAMPFAQAHGVLAVLRRYEVEAARAEAREVADGSPGRRPWRRCSTRCRARSWASSTPGGSASRARPELSVQLAVEVADRARRERAEAPDAVADDAGRAAESRDAARIAPPVARPVAARHGQVAVAHEPGVDAVDPAQVLLDGDAAVVAGLGRGDRAEAEGADDEEGGQA